MHQAMGYVHHCHFCGWHREADSATVLAPACENCGAALSAIPADQIADVRKDDAGTVEHAVPSSNAGGLFALLVTVPWVLPLAGVRMGDLIFLVPLALLIFATERCFAAARVDGTLRAPWRLLGTATALATMGSAVAVVSAIGGDGVSRFAFYIGALGSIALVLGVSLRTARVLSSVRGEAIVDAALAGLLLVTVSVWYVFAPAGREGDSALIAVLGIDLLALVLAMFALTGDGPAARPATSRWLVSACAAATIGDAFVAMDAAHMTSVGSGLTAILWAVAGYSLACAADHGLDRSPPRAAGDDEKRWSGALVPVVTILALPAMAVTAAVADPLSNLQVLYWAVATLLALGLAFGRQAWLLSERQRAVLRERQLRRTAARRNEELEALTSLATTMTQTLEEAPIVDQALAVVHTAARASSTGLHVWSDGELVLHATTGSWPLEHSWAGAPAEAPDGTDVALRGGRCVLRLRLEARGTPIGVITVIRPGDGGFDDDELELLRLLVDEMGLAVQNERDYREKLEQAIRDPLTGLYNRRFFHEALEKEVARSERYGSEASLVMFDIDNFKLINDTHGHSVGDDVLRHVAAVSQEIVRPSDSFARVGGEEFALLLPETSQLEALLVAERLRTAVSRSRLLGDHRVTLSGGIASCPGDATQADELQRRADAALYWAKRNGRDLCAVASEVQQGDGEPADAVLVHLYALVAMIDARHRHTRDHSENVASYAVALGHELGLERERIVRLRRAAMLHDLGKVSVPETIINKPAALSHPETEAMRTHAQAGGMILSHAGLEAEAAWVRHHHERYDGTGYPDGLAGEEIPLESRIMFVADAFEAMTSDRPDRAGMPVADAVGELRRGAGTQFDPAVTDALERLVSEDRLALLALRSGDAPPA